MKSQVAKLSLLSEDRTVGIADTPYKKRMRRAGSEAATYLEGLGKAR